VTSLDPATAALVRVASALTDADEVELERLMREALAAGALATWLDELVLAGVLFAGFPRALVFAAALRRLVGRVAESGDATDYDSWREWARRGSATARVVYGANYEKLRENVAKLHPVLDPWIVVDGYGRILSRPGLDALRRELCAVAMLVPQGVPRQLHSHFRGALNAGASRRAVEEVLSLVESQPFVPKERARAARELWSGLSR
jgi:4-carboxymuconolactone decarboxylase